MVSGHPLLCSVYGIYSFLPLTKNRGWQVEADLQWSVNGQWRERKDSRHAGRQTASHWQLAQTATVLQADPGRLGTGPWALGTIELPCGRGGGTPTPTRSHR